MLAIMLVLALAGALGASDTYVKAHKGLYVWNASTKKPTPRASNHRALAANTDGLADRLAAFAKLHGFTRVYLFAGSIQWDWESLYQHHKLFEEEKLAETVAMLNRQGVEVHLMWYLNDEANDLQNHERAADLVNAVAGFNQRHKQAHISGLHCDQEPDKTEAYKALTEMFTQMSARNKELKAGLSLGAAFKPLWIRQDWQSRKVFQHLLDALDTATLMAYSNKPATVKQLAAPLLAYCEKVGKVADVAIETGGYNAAPEETFSEVVKTDPAEFLEIAGSLADDFAKLKGFDQLVIHAYAQYFNGLYGIDPDSKDATPTKLHGPIASDAALPEPVLPEGANGFVGKLTGVVTVVGQTGFAVKVAKIKAASNSRASDAAALDEQVVVIRAGADDLHARWIGTIKPKQEVTVEVETSDGELRIVALSSAQKKTARKAD
jgi:hypothetical protein